MDHSYLDKNDKCEHRLKRSGGKATSKEAVATCLLFIIFLFLLQVWEDEQVMPGG